MGIYGNRSARRVRYSEIRPGERGSTSASDIGICFAVIGHMDERKRAAHLVSIFMMNCMSTLVSKGLKRYRCVGASGVSRVRFRRARRRWRNAATSCARIRRYRGRARCPCVAGELRLDEKRQHATRAAPYVKKVGFFRKIQFRKRFSKMKYGVGVGSWAPLLREACRTRFSQRATAQRRNRGAHRRAKSWSLLETFRGADMRRAWFAFMPTRFYSSSSMRKPLLVALMALSPSSSCILGGGLPCYKKPQHMLGAKAHRCDGNPAGGTEHDGLRARFHLNPTTSVFRPMAIAMTMKNLLASLRGSKTAMSTPVAHLPRWRQSMRTGTIR